MKQKGTTVSTDYDADVRAIRKGCENAYTSKMRYASWKMDKKTEDELQEEVYQKEVDERSDAWIAFYDMMFL